MTYLARIEQFGERWYGLLALFAIPLAVVFAPLLFGSAVLYWGDDVSQAAPYFTFWGRAIEQGESILWNPDNFGGYPAHATAFGFFAPWNYFIALFIDGPLAALHVLPWWTLVVFTLAAFFAVRLLREFGVSFWPAYAAGIAYTLSHQTDAFLPAVINFHLFLPLLFFVIWRLSVGASRWYVLWGVLAVGFGWLAVNFQETFYILIGGAIFASFLAVRQYRRGEKAAARRFLLLLFICYAVGTAIGMVQILPTQLMATISTRAGGVSYAFAAEDALLPSDFLRWVIPDFKLPLGIPFGSRGASVPLYLGAIPLLFFFAAWRDRAPLARFFAWLFGLIVATAIVYSPIFWLLSKLPIFSYFRVPDRWMFLAVFAAVMLSAMGLERYRRSADGERSWLRLLAWFSAITGTVGLAVIALNVVLWRFEAFAIAGAKRFFERFLYAWYQPEGTFPVSHYFAIIDKYFLDLRQYLSLEQPIVFTSMTMLAVSLVVLFLVMRRPGSQDSKVAVLAMVVVVNFVAVKSFDYSTMPAAAVREIPSTIAYLRAHPGRAIPFLYENYEENVARERYGLRGNADKFQYRAAMLVPNTNLLYGIDSAIIKDGLEPAAYARLASLVGAPVIGIPRELPHGDLDEAQRLIVERKPLLEFLGIRYIVSGYPLDERAYPKVFSGTVSEKAVPVSIYENSGARKLLSFANAVSFRASGLDAIFEDYRESGFRGMFADCRAPCVPGERAFAPGALQLLERENTLVRVRTSSAGPAFLVLSQNNLPGWHAFVDGEEVERHTVNTVFIGVEVPAGNHEIEFRYENPCGGWGFAKCLRSLLP